MAGSIIVYFNLNILFCLNQQDGEVIGINCITVQQAAGISFAIPSDIVAEFLDGAVKREKDFVKNGGFFRKAKRNEKFYIGQLLHLCHTQF